ncbi:MAG: ComF family protein [Brevinema sp.]
MTTNIFQSFTHFMLKRPCINCGMPPKMPWFLLCSSCVDSVSSIDRTNRCSFCLNLLSEGQACLCCSYMSFTWNQFDALWDYNDVAAQLFLKYKFEGSLASEKDFIRLLSPRLQQLKNEEATILLIPSGKETWQRLGFHPLENLLKQCGLNPIIPFEKIKGQAQKKLSAKERRSRKGFLKLKKGFVSPKNVLLMDDIISTGATCQEGVRLLYEDGAEIINVFALFRN